MNRSFAAPNRALFRTAQAPRAPLGRVGGPTVTSAPGAGGGPALALADAILRQHGRRDIVDPELEPLDPDINDPDPLYEIEPEDPSHESSLARQNGDEDDEEEPTPEDEPAASAQPQGRQNGEEDEDDEEMQAAKDITVIAVEAEEKHDHEPADDYEMQP